MGKLGKALILFNTAFFLIPGCMFILQPKILVERNILPEHRALAAGAYVDWLHKSAGSAFLCLALVSACFGLTNQSPSSRRLFNLIFFIYHGLGTYVWWISPFDTSAFSQSFVNQKYGHLALWFAFALMILLQEYRQRQRVGTKGKTT